MDDYLSKKIHDILVDILAQGGGGGVVTQPDPALLKATVTQAAAVPVYQPLKSALNATVEQWSKDRTITGSVAVTNSDIAEIKATLNSIKDTVGIKKITDPVEVVQDVFTDLKTNPIQMNSDLFNAKVFQFAKDRTITNTVDVNVVSGGSQTILGRFFECPHNEELPAPLWLPAEGKNVVLTDMVITTNSVEPVFIVVMDGSREFGFVFAGYVSNLAPIVVPFKSSYTTLIEDEPILLDACDGGDVDSLVYFSMKGYEI